jgi:hypothetical protein
VVESLPNKYEALSSTPVLQKIYLNNGQKYYKKNYKTLLRAGSVAEVVEHRPSKQKF